MTGIHWQGGKWDGKRSPYIHWLETMADTGGHLPGAMPLQETVFAPSTAALLAPEVAAADSTGYREVAAATRAVFGDKVPLPDAVTNAGFEAHMDSADWLPPMDGITADMLPPDDAVIVGVIDTAIAVGHQRFLEKDGAGTRFLAAWQQSGPPAGAVVNGVFQDQPYLPFGREILKPEIDRLLAECRAGGGALDEGEFNHRAGLVDMINLHGQRELNFEVAHGTHVLDTASGFDITDPEVSADMLARRPLIAVTLPNQFLIGPSGNYLEYFVIHAVQRIVDLADAFWQRRQDLVGKCGNRSGYPIVINLSYGLQAGPKDGTMVFETFVTRLTEARLRDGKSPVRVVLPAGNANLDKGNAVGRAGGGTDAPFAVDWHLQPEDQTPNFLEIWSGELTGPDPRPMKLRVTLPDGTHNDLSAGADGEVLDFGTHARVYAREVTGSALRFDDTQQVQAAPTRRQNYILCTAPTQSHQPGAPQTPSGKWRIEIVVDEADPLDIYAGVQTDQSYLPGQAVGLLAYLDDARYEPLDGQGDEKDTYLYSPRDLTPDEADQEPLASEGPLQRKGTLNAIASLQNAVVVAGFRRSDGQPATYSSTASPPDLALGRGAPTASFPSDDGPAHDGMLAAGSRSGSVVRLQGTSFATAAATRLVADRLESWTGDPHWLHVPGGPADIRALAEAAETTNRYTHKVFAAKSGLGRVPMPQVRKAADQI
ncbi:MAG: hypothetical protein ACWA5A_16575 [Marinibacterium sp.]